MSGPIDYYEVLQINRNADAETIHRVYRFMAARFHPDNTTSGDLERFLLLRQAYETLSDAARRAQYDSSDAASDTEPLPIFALRDFIDGAEGEINRRLGVLSILYHRRRKNDSKPCVSLLDLEKRMSLPREYLDFTLWYLRSKGYVAHDDVSDYGLTAAGVDYLESVAYHNKMAKELLRPQIPPVNSGMREAEEEEVAA